MENLWHLPGSHSKCFIYPLHRNISDKAVNSFAEECPTWGLKASSVSLIELQLSYVWSREPPHYFHDVCNDVRLWQRLVRAQLTMVTHVTKYCHHRMNPLLIKLHGKRSQGIIWLQATIEMIGTTNIKILKCPHRTRYWNAERIKTCSTIEIELFKPVLESLQYSITTLLYKSL